MNTLTSSNMVHTQSVRTLSNFRTQPAVLPSRRGALQVRAATAEGVPLACPVALKELDITGKCASSGLTYKPDPTGIWDLTIGAAEGVNTRKVPANVQEAVRDLLPRELKGFIPNSSSFGTSTFELPSVAFAYERGWRESFNAVGFPGPDEEFVMAQDKLRPMAEGGLLVDASCGSGLFTRRFVQAGMYKNVVALDFSDSMLNQARKFFEEEMVPTDTVTFVRADIGRMPFPDDSVDGVHAGAAIHCWPNPEAAVAEIARVLKPGATYCGTTFLNPTVPFLDEDSQALASSLMRGFTGRAGFNYWDKRALQDIFESCGFENFEFDIKKQFIFYSLTKPMPPGEALAEEVPSGVEEEPVQELTEPEVVEIGGESFTLNEGGK